MSQCSQPQVEGLVTAKWMWGDANILGHALARKNPLRWSSVQGIDAIISELQSIASKEKYDANRPVNLAMTRDGTDEVEYDCSNIADAISKLQGAAAKESGSSSASASSPTQQDATHAILTLPDGRTHKITILKGQLGEETFLDIRDLHAKTGCFTYDPGFTCTASCMSGITFIDGPKGVCLYRGYPVQDLVENADALEVAFLVLRGNLPNKVEMREFSSTIKDCMMVHGKVERMFDCFGMKAHPMAVLVAVIGGLSTIFSTSDCMNPEDRKNACVRLTAKVPVLAAMAYKTSIGEPIVYPREDLTFAENWLYMMFSTPVREYKVHPVHAKAINAFMILHMDHEQNASTSTVRTAGSSQANPYACIAAGVASLWGPAHGGANEAVIKMLEEIGHKDNVKQFVEDIKAKKEGVRLMGFGHRVYKNYDPRAKVMKNLVDEVLRGIGVTDPLLEVAHALEETALNDDYFVKRKLYPNVDYYSGIMLRALGIPTSMFTVMFAMSRTVGWMAQWNEMVTEGQMRITRPRQVYAGEKQRDYKTDKAEIDSHEVADEFEVQSKPERPSSQPSLKSSTSFKIELPADTVTR